MIRVEIIYEQDKDTIIYEIEDIIQYDFDNIMEVYRHSLLNYGYGFELDHLLEHLGIDFKRIENDISYVVNQIVPDKPIARAIETENLYSTIREDE